LSGPRQGQLQLGEPTKVVATGGRRYAGRKAVYAVLDLLLDLLLEQLDGKLAVATGGATGLDQIVEDWCVLNHVALTVFDVAPEEWTSRGRAAGPARNRRMLKYFAPHFVLAFPGNAGTRSCIKSAEKLGIEVKHYG
jgi:hypothetical protein